MSYVLVLALFSVRPLIPELRDTLWGSGFGAWSMYRTQVEVRDGAVLIAPGVDPIPVDITTYFWHARFAGTAHGEPRPPVIAEFARFLVGRPELCNRVRERASAEWTLVVFVAYRSGSGPVRSVESRLPACRRA
ncbi:MAG TPA: hypothetical protein VGI70_00435 [Polyangiales bacterium]